MAISTPQPTLYKPKSKIRLRLGLTPPHPKPKQPETVHVPAVPSLQASIASQTPSSTSTPNPTSSFNASTNTVSSQPSRADSRDAFAYDHDNSPESINFTQSPAVDVISYISTSPVSVKRVAPIPNPLISPHRAVASPMPLEENTHPHITAAASADDIFSLTDQQLADRFSFISEIGFGNWGSVWLCKPKHVRSSALGTSGKTGMVRLGKMAAAGGGSGAGGKVAIKLVHRSKTPTTATRVRALWGEMKIIRTLRHEPHPSIIQFEAFVITPSYALVIMPHLSHLIPVCLPPSRATPYFRQLASAVGYLHERGITHNDIKPANVLLSHNDIPVLVDFGFAQKWDAGGRGSFLSSISWGTPEYLDPQRARGMPHDERASDVWSLGITMYEVLIGRTPFEADEEEQFDTADELVVYHERTKKGVWVGQWFMPHDMQHLLRAMICPDPAYRITAIQAYHHPALQPSAPSVIITPHFVRAAASFDIEDEPMPPLAQKADTEKKGKKCRNKKKDAKDQSRASTPTALGESIKQHTSVSRPKARQREGLQGVQWEERTPSPKKDSKLVIKWTSHEDLLAIADGEDKESQDPTPTKMIKKGQELRVKESSAVAEHKVIRRISSARFAELGQPVSTHDSSATGSTEMLQALNERSSTLSSGTAPKTKEEAALKTMRSLEGVRHSSQLEKAKGNHRDVLSAITRPAPDPPRPQSLNPAQDSTAKRDDQRRSLGLRQMALVEVREEDVQVRVTSPGKAAVVVNVEMPAMTEIRPAQLSPQRNVRAVPTVSETPPRNSGPTGPSPARPRPTATRPTDILVTGKPFPNTDSSSPLDELREKIMKSDQEKLVRFRQFSGDLVAPPKTSTRSSRMGKTSMPATSMTEPAVPPIPRTRSFEALALDGRLDKIAHWVKDVERIVEDARRALAEGREPILPIPGLPVEITQNPTSPGHRLSLIPGKGTQAESAVVAHLRAMSTQAEPATPPKWMTYAEAEETVKQANDWIDEDGPKGKTKKERPLVSQVTKLFGTEIDTEQLNSRNNTPEPMTVPLKPTQLRGVPSTPALRSSTRLSRLPLTRKSESNLRNSKIIPAAPSPVNIISPRRAVYEDLLGSTPGVVRKGDGWSSHPSGRAMAKPSSMASLRERAIAFLRDDREPKESKETGRHIVDLAAEVSTKRIPARPGTPGAGSTLNASQGQGKKKGFFGRLKEMVAGRHKGTEGL